MTMDIAKPLDRRALIRTGLFATGSLLIPRMAFAAAPTDKRFVFIIQRGAADGLHMLPPLGDPGYAALRGQWTDGLAGAAKIDGLFSLHPAMTRTAQLFAQKQAIGVHAVASAYRDRSHFDGQNILETGGLQAYAERSGWMNRLVAALPAGDSKALAVAAEVPMALRGPQPVSSYAPSRLPNANDDLLARVSQLYAGDPQLHQLWDSALSTRAMAGVTDADKGQGGADMGRIAASLMRPDNGARLVMIETGGWDTHSGQVGRLAAQLRNLDTLIGTLADGLGPAWGQTIVLVATEFGRTAAINGTNGTDHGTASAALLLGGGLQGGRVAGDWPGLSQSALYEGRDLKPTMAVESLVAGALAGHFGLDAEKLVRTLYPAQAGLKPFIV
jgi:uncharacterized protein (DUF1501 family)